ncbi:hypothetical protein BD560DRAFT_443014 [Blakeslea trispora]|nr:hypothetical protein BD560DRAFT_443014 [Blakeslea trispora]
MSHKTIIIKEVKNVKNVNISVNQLKRSHSEEKFDEETCITKHFKDEKQRTELTRRCYEEVRIKKASQKAGDEDDFEPVDENSETSFMLKHLLPYLEEIFLLDPHKHMIYAAVDGTDDNGYIPDWKLGFGRYKKKELFCFFVEVKRPGESSKY